MSLEEVPAASEELQVQEKLGLLPWLSRRRAQRPKLYPFGYATAVTNTDSLAVESIIQEARFLLLSVTWRRISLAIISLSQGRHQKRSQKVLFTTS
jgi:hypothetical protein